ncbi:nucleotidyltransferase family protein [soil metagenome]
MSSYSDIEKRLITLKPILSERYNVMNIGVFGSFAEGENTSTSDLDILVELNEPLGWEFFALKDYLESEFNRPVDLVTRNALKKQLVGKILSQTKFV